MSDRSFHTHRSCSNIVRNASLFEPRMTRLSVHCRSAHRSLPVGGRVAVTNTTRFQCANRKARPGRRVWELLYLLQLAHTQTQFSYIEPQSTQTHTRTGQRTSRWLIDGSTHESEGIRSNLPHPPHPPHPAGACSLASARRPLPCVTCVSSAVPPTRSATF